MVEAKFDTYFSWTTLKTFGEISQRWANNLNIDVYSDLPLRSGYNGFKWFFISFKGLSCFAEFLN